MSNSFFSENFAYINNNLESTLYGYSLELVKNELSAVDEYFVSIKSNDGNTVYLTKSSYRIRDTLLVTWDDHKLLCWIYSGDVGTTLVEYVDDEWIEYSRTTEKYPAAFIELEPEKFSGKGK